jgi:hypothetical protein
LISAQVVTAGGQIVEASAYEHPDLFWRCAAAAAILVS